MDFFEAVSKRRSVRKFKDEKVPSQVIEKALDAALLAPNSSNMQAWEFYWVRTPELKKKVAAACFDQPAASTAQELVVAVSRVDTWRRNRKIILDQIAQSGTVPPSVSTYYGKVVPLSYLQDPFGILGVVKTVMFNAVGLFRVAPRGPAFRSDLFEVVTKSTALGCENLMLALAAQGYDSCPMEGFDAVRLKRLLKLNRHCRIAMVIGVGRGEPSGVFGPRLRIPRELSIFEV